MLLNLSTVFVSLFLLCFVLCVTSIMNFTIGHRRSSSPPPSYSCRSKDSSSSILDEYSVDYSRCPICSEIWTVNVKIYVF